MKMKSLLAALLLSMVFVVGCGEKKPSPAVEPDTMSQPQDQQVDQKIDQATMDAQDSAADAFKAKLVEDGMNSYYEMVVPGANGNVSVKLPIVFFAFDKFTLTSESQAKIKDFAEFVKENGLSGLTISVGGHCDEWGSDEYNYALGLKRAKAVEDALKNYASDVKVTTVSYGESKPLCSEHNKNCWKENRRSEVTFLP